MRGYSLQDIIENNCSLPEHILQNITIQLLEAMEEYKHFFNNDYGEICSCDILFDKHGKLKIRPNLIADMVNLYKEELGSEEHLCRCEEFFHHKLRIFDTDEHDQVISSTNQSISYNNKRARMPKYFSIGYVVLVAAIGGLNFDSLNILFNYFSKEDDNSCCLYHFLVDIEKANNINRFSIHSFISRYSELFRDFLCQSLSFKTAKGNLKSHPWLKSQTIHSRVKLSLKEIIKITRDYKAPNTTDDKKFQSFINNYEIIRSNNGDISYHIKDKIINHKSIIKDLCREIGVGFSEFSQKLQNIII
jgi:hypothetical protein